MAGLDIQKFVGGVIGAIVCVIIVVAVGVPILTSNQVADTAPNADAINSMINIIPLLLVVAIIIAIVGLFLYSRKN